MTDKPYTDTDVELIAATFVTEAKKNPIEPGTPPWLGVQTRMLIGPTEHDIARAVLDALAAAGRLLPADAETQWGVRFLDRKTRQPHSSVYPAVTEREARAFAVSHAHIDEVGEALKRRVTAWTPAPEESA